MQERQFGSGDEEEFKATSDSVEEKQRIFQFGEIVVSSKIQSGNAKNVIRKQLYHFQIWLSADPKSSYSSWFYYTVKGIPAQTYVTFTIMNMSNQIKLFKQNHVPVWKTENKNQWQRIPSTIPSNCIIKTETGYQVLFKFLFTQHETYHFAFTFPWTLTEQGHFTQQIIKNPIYKNKIFLDTAILGRSFKNRDIQILTITGSKNKDIQIIKIPNLQSQTYIFPKKRGIFISARVHPGQSASSHIMNGFIKTLLSMTEDSLLLLENFVFYLVPIINPDGVSQGNFRNDSQGQNLNRFYTNPLATLQPQIYYIKQFLVSMIKAKHIQFMLDLHAHVNKQGAFIYGNSVNDLKKQTQICLFAKILSYNCEIFDYQSCNFSEKNMSSKDKADELSKQGASRVALYKQTGLAACWTLECNYNSAKIMTVLGKNVPEEHGKNVSDIVLKDSHSPQVKLSKNPIYFNIQSFESIGKGIAQSILDYYHCRPSSRIYNNKLKSYENFKLNMGVNVLRMIPFKFDSEIRKILSGLNGINVSQSLRKISSILNNEQTIKILKVPQLIKKKTEQPKNNNINIAIKLTQNSKPVTCSLQKITGRDNSKSKTNETKKNSEKILGIKKNQNLSFETNKKILIPVPTNKYSKKAINL